MPRRIEAIEGGCGIFTKRAITGIAMLSFAGLAGCNTGSMLDLNSGPTPAGTVPGGQTGLQQQPTETALALQTDAANETAAAPLQAVTTSERIQFAPVIGATAEAVPALSRRLEARARQSGIAIVPQGGSAPW